MSTHSDHTNDNYKDLRKSLKGGQLYNDSQWICDGLFQPSGQPLTAVKWKRPSELSNIPRLFDHNRIGFSEGEIGLSAFLPAVACLASDPLLLNRVLPNIKEQEYNTSSNYAGIVRFMLCRFGTWTEVIIDDSLPVSEGRPAGCQDQQNGVYWSSLLEKACAKMYGGYETMRHFEVSDFIVDVTGAVVEKLALDSLQLDQPINRKNFYHDLSEELNNRSVITCFIKCTKNEIGVQTSGGLLKGCYYIVNSLKEIFLGKDKHLLARIDNPHGKSTWTGPWSISSEEWTNLNIGAKTKLGLTFTSASECWMNLNDFVTTFTNVDVCHFARPANVFKRNETEAFFFGEWQKENCPKDLCVIPDEANLLSLQQYVFDVTLKADTVLISLEQNVFDGIIPDNIKSIGLILYKVEDNRRFRLHITEDIMASIPCTKTRTICSKIRLEKGRYVIIPFASALAYSGSFKFLLRIFTSENSQAQLLRGDHPLGGMCVGAPKLATKIKVVKCEGLRENVKLAGGMNAYVVIKCEGETVQSLPRASCDPEWNLKALFYRKKPDTERIVVEVYSRGSMTSTFLGLTVLDELSLSTERVTKEYDLFTKNRKETLPGKLTIEVASSTDLDDF